MLTDWLIYLDYLEDYNCNTSFLRLVTPIIFGIIECHRYNRYKMCGNYSGSGNSCGDGDYHGHADGNGSGYGFGYGHGAGDGICNDDGNNYNYLNSYNEEH